MILAPTNVDVVFESRSDLSPAPLIRFDGDSMRIHFDDFGPASYKLFLKAKRLPEFTLDFDMTETYTVSAPRRFASMLGVEPPPAPASDLPLSSFLFDDQCELVKLGLDAKRFAVWSDCGGGKTLISLEWARHVIHRTGGRVLVVTLNEIVQQWIEEAEKFYGELLPIIRMKSREEMREWCASGTVGGVAVVAKLAVVNYEKFNPGAGATKTDEIVNELRHLSGIVLDESSRLANSGGKQKWAIIKSSKGIPYKLSCTATPAPNDTMEFASQASFLERMRSEGEIIWTYFIRDPKSHRWVVKNHARKAFFEFMSSWSIYVRDPKKYGWRLDLPEVPEPTIITHEIKPTREQLDAAASLITPADGQGELFPTADTNTIQRAKLSQVAKGFIYRKGEAAGKFDRIPSAKPKFVADLIRQEVAAGHQVLVWTTFNAETLLILEHFIDSDFRVERLDGSTSEKDRLMLLEDFRKGRIRALVSKSSLLGYGMNFQFCRSMIFSGFSDSYVAFYQAIRRAYRFGQTESVRVHIPVVSELETDMLENVLCKDARMEADIAEMETNYIAARRATTGAA